MSTLYGFGTHNFHYVALVTQNSYAGQRLSQLNTYYTPTTYIDAGQSLVIGGYSNPSYYGGFIETSGEREVPAIDLVVSMTAQAGNTYEIDVSATLNTFINAAPEKPSIPDGVQQGTLMTDYTYTTTTTDLEGDQLWYKWDWGDGQQSDWLGPYESGEEASATHSWDVSNTYQIKVKAKDTYDAESIWSSAFFAYFEGIPWMCGDANGDDGVNVSDAVWIINYVFVTGSPPPDPLESGNVNCDSGVNVSDAVWIINYVFVTGSPGPCECK